MSSKDENSTSINNNGLNHNLGKNPEASSDKDKNSENELIINSQAEKITEAKSIIKKLKDEINGINSRIEQYASVQERLNFITGLFTDFIFSIIVSGKNNLKLEWINKNFSDQMGYPFETLLDVDLSRNVLHYDDYSYFQEALAEAINGERKFVEIRLLHGTRNIAWYNFSFFPVRESNMPFITRLYGTCSNVSLHRKKIHDMERVNDELSMLVKEKNILFEHTINNLQDEIQLRKSAENKLKELEEKYTQYEISESKSANEQLRLLSTALEQISSGIFLTGINGQIIYSNKQMTGLTGFEKEELIGQSPRIFKSDRQTEELYKDLCNTILAGNNWKGELEIKKKSGEYCPVSVSVSPVRNDEGVITHFLSVEDDITNRKKIEAELIESKGEAEEANKTKSLLIANISHELRTPLNAVLGFAQLLSENEKNLESSLIIEKITLSGKRLLQTLNLILASTELESKNYRPNYKEIDLNFFCTTLKSSYEQRAAEKNLQFELDIPQNGIKIISDEYLLYGIISNLVENAIKYTKTGIVRVELNNEIRYEGNEFTLINVKDTGIGIKKENYEIIFRKFRQVSEGFHREFEGLGLGLSLANRMAQLLGIKILVESEWHKGSNFSVLIPVNKCNIPFNNKPTTVTGTGINLSSLESLLNRQLKILLVEDNLLNVEVVEMFLKKYWEISSVNNGEEAVNRAKNSNFDLLLIDINLGQGMSGIEVLKQIRQLDNYRETPSIAITGYASEKHKRMFLEQGFTSYLAKPFYKKELIDMIKGLVKTN